MAEQYERPRRPIIPQALHDDPWPPESSLPHNEQSRYNPDLSKLEDALKNKDPENQGPDTKEPIELSHPLDVMAQDGIKLTFGEMVQFAKELRLSERGTDLPNFMELALIIHSWIVLRAKGHKFEKPIDSEQSEASASQGISPTCNGNGRKKVEKAKKPENEPNGQNGGSNSETE